MKLAFYSIDQLYSTIPRLAIDLTEIYNITMISANAISAARYMKTKENMHTSCMFFGLGFRTERLKSRVQLIRSHSTNLFPSRSPAIILAEHTPGK